MTRKQPTSHNSTDQPFDALIPFPLGGKHWGLGIRTSDKGLVRIDYINRPTSNQLQTPLVDEVAREVVRQLQAYFADPQWKFDLPLDLQGTDFQRRLWSALVEIPTGSTDTYGQLAGRLNSGAQAVGQACRRNPVSIVVPCHRVLSLHGVGGYSGAVAGDRLDIKLALLKHEGFLVKEQANG